MYAFNTSLYDSLCLDRSRAASRRSSEVSVRKPRLPPERSLHQRERDLRSRLARLVRVGPSRRVVVPGDRETVGRGGNGGYRRSGGIGREAAGGLARGAAFVERLEVDLVLAFRVVAPGHAE